MNDAAKKGSGRIIELDSLRGILALWVVAAHIFSWTGFAHWEIKGRLGKLWYVLVAPEAAVQTFFILSGFAITHLLHARSESYLGFMVGRWFRIYPIYLICLFASAAAALLTPSLIAAASWRDATYLTEVLALSESERGAWAAHLCSHLTLLNGMIPRGLLPNSSATFLPPAWSISVEWQYYLMAPLIARLVCRGPGLLALTSLAWVGARHVAAWQNPLMAFLLPLLPFFLIGVASYHLHAWFLRSGGKRSSRLIVPIIAGLSCALFASWHSLTLAIWLLAFGSLFVDGDSWMARAFGWIRQGLGLPVLEWLGRISYPVYLVHWPIIILLLFGLLKVRPTLSGTEAMGWLVVVGIPVILGVAQVLHSRIEMPFMRLGRNLAARRRASPAIALT